MSRTRSSAISIGSMTIIDLPVAAKTASRYPKPNRISRSQCSTTIVVIVVSARILRSLGRWPFLAESNLRRRWSGPPGHALLHTGSADQSVAPGPPSGPSLRPAHTKRPGLAPTVWDGSTRMVPVGSCRAGAGQYPARNHFHAVLYGMPSSFAHAERFMRRVYKIIEVNARSEKRRQLSPLFLLDSCQ